MICRCLPRLPCCVRRLQSPAASRCLPFGPFAPFVGSAGNAGFAGLTWQRCCPGYLLTPPPLTLSALWCLEWKHKTTAYQQKRIRFFMKLPLKWYALINMCIQTEIIYTKLHCTDKSAGSPTHYTYRSCLQEPGCEAPGMSEEDDHEKIRKLEIQFLLWWIMKTGFDANASWSLDLCSYWVNRALVMFMHFTVSVLDFIHLWLKHLNSKAQRCSPTLVHRVYI